MKWIKFDGYDEEHLYVDSSEKVLGSVNGSPFQRQNGWVARAEEDGRLGRYMTLDAAKSAVELSCKDLFGQPDTVEDEGKVAVLALEDYAALKRDAEKWRDFRKSFDEAVDREMWKQD
jgi:hypothetical protein